MGYACPVCETPQRDGEHLAHHLAFTAMLHGGDHEAWLDDHAPDWGDRDPAGLAAEVTPHAADAEYHEVFEDTVNRGRPDVDVGEHDHAGHGRGHAGHGTPGDAGLVDGAVDADPEVAAAVRAAREMAQNAAEDDGETDGHPDDETAAAERRSADASDGADDAS
ncbi:DUF5810 domain-containing protein [Halorubrum sp. PV6]|uniref:DUF5810 domain-containing protein n=1 Tax=Halorubrum sp. PV6 TaxID=634157 RepID=UPI000F8539D8|nr:DUF5810 domain-containing protein [Halorubrum sp. PV6]AZQ15526.1 hypothetical protein DOS48_12145 [Halorubrum sp. PV6]